MTALVAMVALTGFLAGPQLCLRTHSHGGRVVPPLAEMPVRSDENFDYFRREREVAVTLPKPLGAVLGESGTAGVKVDDLQEGGSAFETKLLRKGDRLLTVMGADVSQASFDAVMELLIAAPDEVDLKVKRNVLIKKPRAADPVVTIGDVEGAVERGVILRTALVKGGVELYHGMNKLTNCGGVGQCSTCWVNVLAGAENLSPPTDAELKKLAKKPETYRMSCQAFVNGDVEVEVPPPK